MAKNEIGELIIPCGADDEKENKYPGGIIIFIPNLNSNKRQCGDQNYKSVTFQGKSIIIPHDHICYTLSYDQIFGLFKNIFSFGSQKTTHMRLHRHDREDSRRIIDYIKKFAPHSLLIFFKMIFEYTYVTFEDAKGNQKFEPANLARFLTRYRRDDCKVYDHLKFLDEIYTRQQLLILERPPTLEFYTEESYEIAKRFFKPINHLK